MKIHTSMLAVTLMCLSPLALANHDPDAAQIAQATFAMHAAVQRAIFGVEISNEIRVRMHDALLFTLCDA